MIFVTVGTQLPFDRLVRVVDAWAATQPCEAVFGQIGPTKLCPAQMEWTSFLAPEDHRKRFEAASLIIAHAGMGTILFALTNSKPLIIMPRRASLGEHRNDHQVATARQFADRAGITVAMDEEALTGVLDQRKHRGAGPGIPAHASPHLLQSVRSFIREGRIADVRVPGDHRNDVQPTLPSGTQSIASGAVVPR